MCKILNFFTFFVNTKDMQLLFSMINVSLQFEMYFRNVKKDIGGLKEVGGSWEYVS